MRLGLNKLTPIRSYCKLPGDKLVRNREERGRDDRPVCPSQRGGRASTPCWEKASFRQRPLPTTSFAKVAFSEVNLGTIEWRLYVCMGQKCCAPDWSRYVLSVRGEVVVLLFKHLRLSRSDEAGHSSRSRASAIIPYLPLPMFLMRLRLC